MNFYPHLLGALIIIIFLIQLHFLNVNEYQPLFFLLFFSLFPDLDHPKAIIRRICDNLFLIIFFLSLFFVIFFSIGIEFFIFSCFYFFLTRFIFFKHRGISHNILFACLVCGVIACIFGAKSGACAFLGYSSHLLLDNAFFKW